jgi:hypothetical protein
MGCLNLNADLVTGDGHGWWIGVGKGGRQEWLQVKERKKSKGKQKQSKF